MTKKILVSTLFVIGVVLSLYFSFSLSDENKDTDFYSVKVFRSDNGWGYQINKDGKTIILQPYMPCIKGNKPFPNEKSALAVGELVLLKIRNNEDPSITMEELNKTIY